MPGIYFDETSRFSYRPSQHEATEAIRQLIAVLRQLCELSNDFWLCLDTEKIGDFPLDSTENPFRLNEVLSGSDHRDTWGFLLDLKDRAPHGVHNHWGARDSWLGIEYLLDEKPVVGLGAAQFNNGVAVGFPGHGGDDPKVQLILKRLDDDCNVALKKVTSWRLRSSDDVKRFAVSLASAHPQKPVKSRPPVQLFVEGGGDEHDLRVQCQTAFKAFLTNAGVPSGRFIVKACGGRSSAYGAYAGAIARGDEPSVLLVDSEGPVDGSQPWAHLAERVGDHWKQPDSSHAENCHLMTQCMETWLIADIPTMTNFFGAGFAAKRLPSHELENVPKEQVYTSLKDATKACKTKAPYGKGAHSFLILEKVDPTLVEKSSWWAKRFIDRMRAICRG